MRMLENEGFRYEGYVDIFDGGPSMVARTDEVKSVKPRQSRSQYRPRPRLKKANAP